MWPNRRLAREDLLLVKYQRYLKDERKWEAKVDIIEGDPDFMGFFSKKDDEFPSEW